jgi:hypothetical protein
MCRQFYDAFGLRTIVLRPSWILDLKQHTSRTLPLKGSEWSNGAICRHQLAAAACGAVRDTSSQSDFCCLHAVTIPDPPLSDYEPERWCNVGMAASVLDGYDFKLDVRPMGYHGPGGKGPARL